MKITFRLLLLAVVVGLGCWLWTVMFPSPEKVLRKKMASLAATVTFGTSDGNLTRAAKAVSLAGFFAADTEIVIRFSGQADRTFSDRQEIKEMAMAGFANLSSLKVQFFDTAVTISQDQQTAQVNCTANITLGGSQDYGVQELHFQFKKMDGEWRIIHVETVKTLS